MRTEATKKFDFGFVLTEAELRRIIGIIEEQMKKLPGNPDFAVSFDLKYRNGALVSNSSLDEVLSEENIGSSQIVELKIKSFVRDNLIEDSISIQFLDIEVSGESGSKPISFIIKGNERDWTFVTSSLLEERTQKIKRASFRKFLGADSGAVLFAVAVLLGLFTFLLVDTPRRIEYPPEEPEYSSNTSVVESENKPQDIPFSEKLEAELRNNKVNDPIQAIVLREKLLEIKQKERAAQFEKESKEMEPQRRIRDEYERKLSEYRKRENENYKEWLRWRNKRGTYLLLLLVAPPLIIFLIRKFLVALYPLYNFCWGDYLEVFNKKEAARKFVLVVILIGIIISFIGGILANYIQFRR